MGPASPLPDEARTLFRAPPGGFVTARDALAASLRADDRADEATVVAALRKPTVVAWSLNQLTDRDPEGVETLLEAGAELRAAQQAALSSKRGATERVRAAGAARKEAVSALAESALAALVEQGRSAAAHADAIAQALETCSVDDDAGAALTAGTLERPPAAASGFGGLLGLSALEGGGSLGDAEAAASARRPRRSAAELKAEVARLRRDRDAARRRATKARGSAEGFAHELEGMRRRLEVVERKHADAEAAASEHELALARAEQELRTTTEELDDAES